MQVTCFYEPLGIIDAEDDIHALQDLWRCSWKQHGWEPVMVGLEEAKKHPLYNDFINSKELANLSKHNDPRYSIICYARWLAYGVVGGFWCDYDVMNYGFKPGDLPLQTDPSTPMFLSAAGACGFANADGYQALINTYAMLINGQGSWIKELLPPEEDINDMTVMRYAHPEWYGPLSYRDPRFCHDYGNEGWDVKLLVHFPHGLTPSPRSLHIKKIKNPLGG